MPEITPTEWQDFLAGYPEAHILQTREWADLKSGFGWKARYLISSEKGQERRYGAQILFRNLPLGFTTAYIAKGPVDEPRQAADPTIWSHLWDELDQICKEEQAVFLKVEPDLWQPADRTALPDRDRTNQSIQGFQPGFQTVQPARTLIVSLHGSEDEILSRMKQKTRYNIRLAIKKGVTVTPSSDVNNFHRLMMITSDREVFGVHTREYYQRVYDIFHPLGLCELLIAENEGDMLAALMVFRRGSRSWYFYGASSNEQRELMSTYLLQWTAMRWAKATGCLTYDLWGVPDKEESQLEAEFMKRQGGLWGVYRFKRGFGGVLFRAQGPWDRVYKPAIYNLYRVLASVRGRD